MSKVIILAGGFGTRVRHLLPGLPKPMAPVNGKPFVEWVVRFFAAEGLTEFILSTGYLGNVITDYFAKQPVPGVHVSTCRESTPLGTAGGALNCVPTAADSQSRWLVVNGDSLVVTSARPLLEALTSSSCDAALLGLRMDDASRYGTLEINAHQKLAAFREKRVGAGIINAGVYAFTGATLLRQPTRRPLSFETDVFPALAAHGHVAVVPATAPFLDIGTPETLGQAERFITENQARFLS